MIKGHGVTSGDQGGGVLIHWVLAVYATSATTDFDLLYCLAHMAS